jgi:hypothetical protein
LDASRQKICVSDSKESVRVILVWVFKRFVQRYSELKDVPELLTESALRCELANGSRVIALPGSERTTRGYACAPLVLPRSDPNPLTGSSAATSPDLLAWQRLLRPSASLRL